MLHRNRKVPACCKDARLASRNAVLSLTKRTESSFTGDSSQENNDNDFDKSVFEEEI